jgi:hypothetical protein
VWEGEVTICSIFVQQYCYDELIAMLDKSKADGLWGYITSIHKRFTFVQINNISKELEHFEMIAQPLASGTQSF